MAGACLKGFFAAEDGTASGGYVHNFKTAVGVERHMEFRQREGVKCRDLSVQFFFDGHSDKPPFIKNFLHFG